MWKTLISGYSQTMTIMNINPISSTLQMKVEALKEKISPAFGKYISVDEGWYQIVADCDMELTAINSNYKILQIKEKMGGLRYYIEPIDATPDQTIAMGDVIRKYEDMSFTICEATGLPGVLMKSTSGWLKTLNPEYAATSHHYARFS